MKHQRNTLLSGIAALALIAGTGIASAQDSSKGESQHGATPHATQQMNHGGTTSQSSTQTQERGSMSKQGQRTEDGNNATKGEKAVTGENRGQKEEQGRSAQTKEKAGSTKSQAGKTTEERNKSATESEQPNRSNIAQDRDRDRMGGKNATEQQNRSGGTNTSSQRGRTGTEGLQGNASGMNVQLNEQQRSEIRTTVIHAPGAPRVSQVDFDVTVGTVIPRGKIRIVPVPETLVRIAPEWRGFLYFVYEDEVVIVNPNDMKIVAVVPA
jgi:Protein of unknown function (DUF1236)